MSREDSRLKRVGKGLLKTSPAYIAANAIGDRSKQRRPEGKAQAEPSDAQPDEMEVVDADKPVPEFAADDSTSDSDTDDEAPSVTGQAPEKALKLIRPQMRPGEEPLFYILGTFKQTIACFEDRCIVAKPGFMAGATFGGMVTSFDYKQVSGIQVQSKMTSGYLEILTSSFQANATKSYWSQGKGDDPEKLPNCIPLLRNAQKAQADKIQRLRDLVTKAKATHASAPATSAGGEDLASQLERLNTLRNSGVLSTEEFDQAKAKLLSG